MDEQRKKHAGGRPQKPLTPIKALPDQPYFTVEEVCDFTGLYKKTIQAKLRAGTLTGKKLNGQWKIYRENFE